MTFCLGMKVADGLVGIADTRVTSGSECITAKKVSVYQDDGWAMFLMTSGLRSVRDKALTYFEEIMDEHEAPRDRLFKVVSILSDQIRRVWKEDGEALCEADLKFNIHVLIGGQMEKDREHKLYMIYPEGNWVEVGPGTPYHIIGASGYGKPVLDRTLQYEDNMRFALKVGCLAFDSTRISAADVDFPVDVVIYPQNAYKIVEHRYQKEDLAHLSNWWQDRLRNSVRELPLDWIEALRQKLPEPSILQMPTVDKETSSG
ncbi:MAG: peptidase [Planctomycetota bacterium]|nr:MAG: peptidase [Planctomycetota bacterium]REJ92955.1 MAG: peptidase [Planctomycetota bacterium]REK30927.1 MAG: peptidase [Planctomycetota bacterium]